MHVHVTCACTTLVLAKLGQVQFRSWFRRPRRLGEVRRRLNFSLGQHARQVSFANISAEGPGLLFDGARLLSAAEIPEEARLNPPIEEGLLPLTNLQGYKQLACRRDGTIVMVSGFNVHVKASCWSAFLERTLVDTI